MATFTVDSPGTYADAMELVKKFQEAGLESNVTVGGVWVEVNGEEQKSAMQQVLDESGHKAHEGTETHLQTWILASIAQKALEPSKELNTSLSLFLPQIASTGRI